MYCSAKSFTVVLAASVLLGLVANMVATPSLWADESSNFAIATPDADEAVVSDRETDDATAVAREVLRLQQQLGGSVVGDRFIPQPAKHLNAEGPHPPVPAPPAVYHLGPAARLPKAKVPALRDAAWQLDTTAHHLELLDLYDQADALRAVATKLRSDARAMKQESETPIPPQPIQRAAKASAASSS